MERQPLFTDVNAVAGTDLNKQLSLGRKFELVGILFASVAAITTHATNVGVLNVYGSDGTTIIWQWDTTTTTGDGTVAAGTVYYAGEQVAGDTAKDWEAAETRTLRTFDAGQPLAVLNDQSGGTGVAFVSAGITFLVRYV